MQCICLQTQFRLQEVVSKIKDCWPLRSLNPRAIVSRVTITWLCSIQTYLLFSTFVSTELASGHHSTPISLTWIRPSPQAFDSAYLPLLPTGGHWFCYFNSPCGPKRNVPTDSHRKDTALKLFLEYTLNVTYVHKVLFQLCYCYYH